MSSADRKLKAAERAATTVFLTWGVALLSSFLTSEGLSDILYPILGALVLGVGVSGVTRRGVGFFAKRMGTGLLTALSLAWSAAAALLLAVFPIGGVLGTSVGMSFPTEFAVVGVITTLASLANLVVLILNIALLTRRGPVP